MSLSIQKEILVILDRFQTSAISKTEEEIFKEISDMDSKYGREIVYRHNIDGIIINIGTRKRSLCLIYHARNRLLNLLQTAKEDYLFYNMGNSLLSITEIKYKNTEEVLIRIKEPRLAREYFNSVSSGSVFPQAFTNLANILERYARNYEAIHIYDRVLKRKPTFGMALGNKAKALLYYYNLVSRKNPEIIFRAEELLKQAIESNNTAIYGGEESLANFKKEHKAVNDFIIRNNIKRPSPKEPLKPISKYHRFCMEKNLFLNFCFDCFHCKNGFTDSFPVYLLDKINIDTKESNYRHSSYSEKTYYSIKTLNQIYEDYGTARKIYFLAITEKFSSSDKITKYSSALDYCKNSLRYGFIKTAYIRLFNIMDKIAHLVYTNYELGQKSIYFTDLKSSKLEKLILEKNSWSLLALHSMAWDFKHEQIYYHLTQIRNYLTHDFIDIKIDLYDLEDSEDQFYKEHHLTEQLLYRCLEDLFLLVKSALIYLINALYYEYQVRRKDHGELFELPIYPQNHIIPG